MSPGEIWGMIVVLAGLVSGAFTLGNWYRGKEANLEIAAVRLEYQKQIAKAEGDFGELKGKLSKTEELNRALRVKSEFFEHTARYYRTQHQNHIEARKVFIDFYRALASRGNDLIGNGYIIHTGGDSVKDCRIVFADSPIAYDVPRDVKGGAILTVTDLRPNP
jgi:hypothetical protein